MFARTTQLINEGGIAEQFIGQHLINMSEGREQPALHYWLREKKSRNAEVDFHLLSLPLYGVEELSRIVSGLGTHIDSM